MNGYLTQMASKRLSWLDDAKMFAMFSVILGHCYPENLIGVDTVSGIIVSFNMQLFMFLAGYTSAKSLECISNWNHYWHYIVKIALHLLLPSYAIGALQALITLDPAAISNEQWFLKMLFRYLLVFASVNWLAMEWYPRATTIMVINLQVFIICCINVYSVKNKIARVPILFSFRISI